MLVSVCEYMRSGGSLHTTCATVRAGEMKEDLPALEGVSYLNVSLAAYGCTA